MNWAKGIRKIWFMVISTYRHDSLDHPIGNYDIRTKLNEIFPCDSICRI